MTTYLWYPHVNLQESETKNLPSYKLLSFMKYVALTHHIQEFIQEFVQYQLIKKQS